MIRVHVICEGQTEEMFVNELLVPHFHERGIVLHPALLGKPGHKGGFVNFERILADVRLRLLNDAQSYCTVLIDFYGISRKFPGYEKATRMNQHVTKSKILIESMTFEIQNVVGTDAIRRFIPYVQMYEFEGLLFSEPNSLASAIGRFDLSDSFTEIRSRFTTPEEINDCSTTAPSKRIEALFPGFEKPIHCTFGALEIGLKKIRKECPLFSGLLTAIENLSAGAAT